MKVIEGLYDGVSTFELDNLAAEVAASKTIEHPDYALLRKCLLHTESGGSGESNNRLLSTQSGRSENCIM